MNITHETLEKPIMSATDSAIIGTYKFLKSKAGAKTITNELYMVTNQDSLSFFEIMFKNDLERLGLI